MIIFADYGLPVVAASYVLTGRFNPEHELEKYPTAEAAELRQEIQLANDQKDKARAKHLKLVAKQERARVAGTSEEWKEYREALHSIAEEAIRSEMVPDRKDLNRFFKHIDEAGTPLVDGNGALWVEIADGDGTTSKVGLSESNALAPISDSRLAYRLILARIHCVLKSPKHSRETMIEFEKDWALLQSARVKNGVSLASAVKSETGTHVLIVPASGDD
jgi:hypothetical protein